MVTVSIIEFGVYGLISYSSFIMLLTSISKEIPSEKAYAIMRCVFLMPGLICAGILASTGVNIQTNTDSTNSIIKNLNDTSTWSTTLTNTTNIVLQNPVWQTVHYMLFAVFLVYIIMQIMVIFGVDMRLKR